MTELKTKHKGEPALRFFREPDLYARIDAATDSGEINRILDSAKHLVELIHPNENNTYLKNELQVAPSDLSCLHTLLNAIDEDRLDEAGTKALKALSKAVIQQTLPLIDHRYFNGLPSPEIPASSIYSGKNAEVPNLIQGEPAEFGIYPAGQPFNSVVTSFFKKHKSFINERFASSKASPVLDTPITKMDLSGLAIDAVSGNYQMFTVKSVRYILNSPNAFTEVSKKEFANAYLNAVEQPQVIGVFALTALSSAYSLKHKENKQVNSLSEEMVAKFNLLISRAYNFAGDFHRGNFMFSSKEFTVSEFAQNPLTVEEIKALPFLTGLYNELYAEVEHNHGVHAEACAAKMRSAGHDTLADTIELNNPAKVTKPVRKHDDDLSPGM